MSRTIKDLVNEYMETMDFEIHGSLDDSGLNEGDITVYGDNDRIFDTFEDYLSISPRFMRQMEGLFGDNVGDYLSDWFSNYFDYEIKDWGEADFYWEDDDD